MTPTVTGPRTVKLAQANKDGTSMGLGTYGDGIDTYKLPKTVTALESLSDGDLLAALREWVGLNEQAMIRGAELIKECDRRGLDYSDLRGSVWHRVRRIADGKLLPALAVQLRGRCRLLNKVSSLPIAVQKRLAEGEPVKVYSGGGEDNHTLVPLAKIENAEIEVVFDRDHIRNCVEQQSKRRAMALPEKASDLATYRVHRREKCLYVTRTGKIKHSALKVILEQMEGT